MKRSCLVHGLNVLPVQMHLEVDHQDFLVGDLIHSFFLINLATTSSHPLLRILNC